MNKDKFFGLNLKELIGLIIIIVQCGIFIGIIKSSLSNQDSRIISNTEDIKKLYETVKLINEQGTVSEKQTSVSLQKLDLEVTKMQMEDKNSQITISNHGASLSVLDGRIGKIETIIPKISEMSSDIRWIKEFFIKYEKGEIRTQ